MADSGSDRTVVVDGSGNGMGSALIAVVILVVLAVGGLLMYRAGVFGNASSKHEIDINVNKK